MKFLIDSRNRLEDQHGNPAPIQVELNTMQEFIDFIDMYGKVEILWCNPDYHNGAQYILYFHNYYD